MKSSQRRDYGEAGPDRESGARPNEEALALLSLRRLTEDGAQAVPVNVYETEVDLMVVAPMPGVHPDDIEIFVSGNQVTLKCRARGAVENSKNYLRHEWHYGPYSRTIDLPCSVDANRANACYGSGLLTLTLPKSDTMRTNRIKLQRLGPARGEVAGHGAKEFAREGHEHLRPGPEATPIKGLRSRIVH